MSETKKTTEGTVHGIAPEEVAKVLSRFIMGLIPANPREDKAEEIETVLQDIRDSLKKQVDINGEIYSELTSLQSASLRREFINHMIGFHRLMEENLDYIIHKMPEDFKGNVEGQLDKVIELYCFIKERIVETLVYDYALCVISPSKGEYLNAGEHFVVGTERTDDESLKNTVGNLVKIGFKDATNEAIFKRADVIALTYTEKRKSADENSNDNNIEETN